MILLEAAEEVNRRETTVKSLLPWFNCRWNGSYRRGGENNFNSTFCLYRKFVTNT